MQIAQHCCFYWNIDLELILIFGTSLVVMVAAREHLERYGWWINELESLGPNIKKTNEFNGLKEMLQPPNNNCLHKLRV
jgi:hypothetical protein